ALIMGPLVGWLVSVINQKFRRYSRRIQDSMGDVTRVAKEGFEAPRLIKVYNAQEHLGRQFDAVNDRNLRSNMKLVLTKGVSNPTVQFDHVSFSYAGAAATESGEPRSRERTAALSDVSLQVAAGESLAIVGRSGSGKSTLVNLLPRFYDAGAGSVRIDGRDVRDYVLRNLRDQIAVVSQDVVLFDDTIRNNIAFGRELPAAALERT